ncbi:hydrolase [Sphingobacterium shayense]|uniref:SGNH/GDSL hydrolase family protein n=1 Tax=Sphingobacterium shayense TaxID=626343 RepID=UPI0015548EB6|nr:SGNH/GDSL hydrolase family protein [Sphingobacterium shayense]NQD70873.1 hydrolase [Sphingobacterium shayense]
MKKYVINFLQVFVGIICTASLLSAQEPLKWVDVHKKGALQGRLDDNTLSGYNRLPDSVKDNVREPVWSLGTNGAGVYVDFKTDAKELFIRYTVSGPLDMPHMPKTGVSGLDLYALDSEGEWTWAPGDYNFKDTITYKFGPVKADLEKAYKLYLPLYNSVTWMEIGVASNATIEFIKEKEKPITIYGTSIAQGGCATRPGLAWTSLLGRALSNPVINLGFSGNGRLEKPIIDLIAKTPSRVIILDCLPNLTGITPENAHRIDSLIQAAVHQLRAAQPNTPIILTDHSSGFNKNILDLKYNQLYEQTTHAGLRSFEKLKKAGVKKLYHLSNADIGLDINSTVDYAHPNDYGMMKISDAYRKLIGKILK